MAASAANNNYGRTRAVVTAQKVYRRQITTIWIGTIDQISSSSFFFGKMAALHNSSRRESST